MTKKITDKRLKWYGYNLQVRRRYEGHMLRRMLDAPLPGKRRRGRQKSRWKVSCNRYMEYAGLRVEDVLDRITWKREIPNYFGNETIKCTLTLSG